MGTWRWFWWLVDPESDDAGNAFDEFDDGLWLVISKKVSILLEYIF